MEQPPKLYFETNIYGEAGDNTLSAVEELKLWGRSDSDLRFYNPLSMPEPAGSKSENVNWKALPTSFDDQFGDDTDALYAFLDNPDPREGRQQDEYCEWVVLEDDDGNITKIISTSESAAYYEFLFYDYLRIGLEKTRALLVKLYKDRCGGETVVLGGLMVPDGNYDPWNNKYAVHMQQPNNSLWAQVNIAAISSILRHGRTDRPITDAG